MIICKQEKMKKIVYYRHSQKLNTKVGHKYYGKTRLYLEEIGPPITRSQSNIIQVRDKHIQILTNFIGSMMNFKIIYLKRNYKTYKNKSKNTNKVQEVQRHKMTLRNRNAKRAKMAVKKHELVQDDHQLDLDALTAYLQMIIDQPNYLPPPSELIIRCEEIVSCLASAEPYTVTWQLLQTVEEFLVRVVNSVGADVRHDVITTIVEKLNLFTSDPQTEVGPATSVVLVVLNTDIEDSRAAARWLVQQVGEVGDGMRSSLACLYTWMFQWNSTPSLGDWVMSLIKALEENESFDVLIEVSLDNLGNLLSSLNDPPSRHLNADVVLHVLASLREFSEAIDAVAPYVDRVLTILASDNGQFSRQLLQNIVDILSSMVHGIATNSKDKAKHAEVILYLERHMASRACEYLQLNPWRARTVNFKPETKSTEVQKVGLTNLGNTCYMNSIVQALLLTRQFSTHVMTRMIGMAYWAKMGVLFAKMMHSMNKKLNPEEFFKVFKPPFFTNNNQHDSSEFLGYLFELLQSFENCSDRNFDYTKPAVLSTTTRNWRGNPNIGLGSASTSDFEFLDQQSRRSVSPHPGSSGCGSSSSSNKRNGNDSDAILPKKRIRILESAHLRRNSFIDNVFGGILLTRTECTECHSASISRDVFRDLQLSFPDKPEGWQHSVQSLLDFYCSKEVLTGENQYHCRECGCLRDAERSVVIESTPKYLILVLKNFKFDPKLHVQTKLMHKVFHNQTVTLPSVRSASLPCTYSLYAAVIHTGTTLHSGHYYTLAKDNDTWHQYNDEIVEAADEQQIHSLPRCCTPYVLFYKRADVDEGNAPALRDLPAKLQECVMSHNKPYVGGEVPVAHISRP